MVIAVSAFIIFSRPGPRPGPVREPEPMTAENSLPPYGGEPITYIGNDPIIRQLPAKNIEAYKKNLALFEAAVIENPSYYDGWISIGVYKKFFNNYQGARAAWEYAKLAAPGNPQAYLNLGNLYAYYLRDLEKGEKNFLAATDRDFNNTTGSYHALANFYRDFGKREEAIENYKKILEFNPQDEAVRVELQRLGVNL